MKRFLFLLIFLITVSANAQTASFQLTYTGITPQAQQAIEKATDIWSHILISSVPIKINITWGDASSLGVLGITISNGIKDFANAPHANVWYPSSLADAIAGVDLQPTHPDLDIFLNSTTDWYYGLDGSCPFWKYDLVSCVLHEIGHGLGFYSIANVNSQNEGSFSLEIEPFASALASFPLPNLNGEPLVYDLFVQNNQGDNLIDTTLYPNPSTLLVNELTGDDLYFSGPNAMAANNNNRPKIYAPNVFAFGSSILHLDETVFHSSTSEALMTPNSSSGEVNHLPGPITAGVLLDIGWNLHGVSIKENETEEFSLRQNFPNPFDNQTNISFFLPKSANVDLYIYDLTGKKIKTIFNEFLNEGNHNKKVNVLDDNGKKISSGVYYYCLKVAGQKFQKKFIIN